jgi:hypothetical protein
LRVEEVAEVQAVVDAVPDALADGDTVVDTADEGLAAHPGMALP